MLIWNSTTCDLEYSVPGQKQEISDKACEGLTQGLEPGGQRGPRGVLLCSSPRAFPLLFLKKIFFFNVYFWDRERQSMNGGGAEREGDTESETGSRPRAVSTEPDAGLELTNREIVTRAEVGRSTD